ncbi:HD domain-containing protein [Bifidobacterium goeldii]|nr:HD domain-containing protein [Bifidobacterium goeldii]
MTGYIPTLDQIDELHHKIAPSQAAYDLVHTHCVIVATIARQLARRQNALFTNRCKLGDTADDTATLPDAVRASAQEVTGGKAPTRLIDEHMVTIGGLLHDIGTYLVFRHDGTDGEPLKFSGKNYIRHGLLGYQYLLDEGVDESVAQFARNHTGVGLTQQMVIAQNLPLPPVDYMPVTLEQEIVMVADKYNSKSVPPKFLTVDAYTRRAARYGEENKRRWLELVAQYGVPNIPALAEKYHMRVI